MEKGNVLQELKELEMKLSRRPTRHDNDRLYTLSRKYFGKWNNMMEEAGYEVKHLQYPKIPKELTPELCYFLGLLITDGHLQFAKRKQKSDLCCAYLFTSYEEEIDMIIELVYDIFEYMPYVGAKKKAGFNKRIAYQITVNSKPLASVLKDKFNFPTGNKSLTAEIPDCIINTTKENKANFLRGVIDGDGCIKKSGCVSIYSGSKRFFDGINLLLISLGINQKRITKSTTSFVMHISNKEDIMKLYRQCYENSEYTYPRKIMAIERVIFKNE